MLCEECKERQATMHVTRIINGQKTELRLCEKCAQEKGGMFMFQEGAAFSFNNLLSGLLNGAQSFQQATYNENMLQCPTCKLTYKQFVKMGRFGCSDCYSAFKDELDPILKRLHGGNVHHHGKIPKRVGGTLHIKKRVEDLRQELMKIIEQEEFEKAAEIRDEIRSLENEIRVSQEGGDK